MKKIWLAQDEIFLYENATKSKWFKICYDAAVRCGLKCKTIVSKDRTTLTVMGPKPSMIKYAFLCAGDGKWGNLPNHLSTIIKFIFA